MGRRGPKPEPAAVKLQKGNTGHRPIGEDPVAETPAVAAAVIQVQPPAWLKKEGLKIWQSIAPRLNSMRLLSQTDADAFARYCRNFARWLKMQKTLDKEGETYESESQHGKLKRAHPAFLIGDRLERALVAAEANFGLNPAERQRIFAQRATAGALGDLFGNAGTKVAKPAPQVPPEERDPDGFDEPPPSTPPSAIGFLN